jgi:siroheme synthase-like protein
MHGYPIELDLRRKKVLVVGLGSVGLRKVRGLLDAGAIVMGVDPRLDLVVPTEIEHIIDKFQPLHLEGVSLAFAAATPSVNVEVVNHSRRLGVWVNAASEPDSGDFSVPAVWREGCVTVSVATSGASPALARTLRDRAGKAMQNGPALAALLLEMRLLVMSRLADSEARRRLLSDWGGSHWLDVWSTAGPEVVKATWLQELEETVESASLLHARQELS